MMQMRLARSLLAALTLAAAACDNALLNDPAAPGATSVVLDLNAGGASEAFDKADRVRVRVQDGSTARVDRTVMISAAGSDVMIPLEFELKRATENLTANVEVRRGGDLLFTGSAELRLRVGRVPAVTVELDPITTALVLPDSLPLVDSYGESIELDGALVFATGDTLAGGLVDEATSLDPHVIAIEAGVLVTRGDGLARLIGRTDSFEDTTRVRVRARIQRIAIEPGDIDVTIGSAQQFSATLYDRNENEIPGRTVAWSSSQPGIVAIDGSGIIVARGIGTSQISAVAENVTSTVTVRATPRVPTVETDTTIQVFYTTAVLRATIDPQGVPGELWFEYDTDSLFASPVVTPMRSIPAGGSVQRTEAVGSLLPATTYYVRAFGRNVAGTTIGDRERFITLSTQLHVTTGPAINVTAFAATLQGTISPAGMPATVWLEWGSTPSLSDAVSTPAQLITVSQGVIPVSFQLIGLYPGATYFYRVVGRSSNGTMAAGAILSFTTIGGSVLTGPQATTLPAQPVRADTAVANGLVNPNGEVTDAWFEWSTDPTFATFTATRIQDVGSGTNDVALAELLLPLTPGTTYYVRVVASNISGTVRGDIVSFVAATTPTGSPPSAMTLPATGVAQTSATINGSVNALGSPTVYWFEWGSSPSPGTFVTSAPVPVGSGNSGIAVSAFLQNLSRTTLNKYFRIVAMNANGTTRGSILVFELRN